MSRSKGAQGLTVGPYRSTYSRILQFHRDQASDSGEVVTPFMQDLIHPGKESERSERSPGGFTRLPTGMGY
jgi:hypothetical protein